MIDLHQPDWPLPEGVHARFSGRRGGVSVAPYDSFNLGDHVGDDPAAVQANRQALLKGLPGAQQIQWLEQVHGTAIYEMPRFGVPAGDASFTLEPGCVCAVMTADCLPVLFASLDGTQVAAAHAGWRGLEAGILLRTLDTFDDPGQVTAYLAPAIGPTAFEVGPEVKAAFDHSFAGAPGACFQPGDGDRWWCDLYQLARFQLTQAGVHSVFGGDACTFTQRDEYFSYRRDGVTGRQASLIWIAR
ncbi:MAG: peptidoglycan editing factor PgeF [Pseudomonadota bacterium]|nr:peptidoglycan editing factor PgeF [Pseudomonadota bacterium]